MVYMEKKGNSRAKVSEMQLYENKRACGMSQGVGTDLGVRIRRTVSVNEHLLATASYFAVIFI